MDHTVHAVNSSIRASFILKYCERLSEGLPFVLHMYELTDADLDLFLEGEPKPNCNQYQYCCILAVLNITGAYLPATPSPYFSPNARWPEFGTSPTSITSATERQYSYLYRDFNHASLMELKDNLNSGERNEKLGVLVEAEMLQVIHSFTSEVFTSLVDEYLELFEEMFKGIILLKNTGITLEDICSVSEDSDTYRCQRDNCTMNMNYDLSSRRSYEIAEFEKELLDLLKKQFESLRRTTKRDLEMPPDENAEEGSESQTCDCEHDTEHVNPYLAYLTEIKSYSPSSRNTEQFAKTLRTQKQMFLRSCLKLLREYNYFRIPNPSCSESKHLYDRENKRETNSPNCRRQQTINDDELFNISVAIYNLTVWHVQSTIFAIFRSVKYDELYKRRILPPTPHKTKFEKKTNENESKNVIKKSRSCYITATDLSASEGDVFTKGSIYTESSGPNKRYLKPIKCDERIQAMPSLYHEDEIKHQHEKHQNRPLNPEFIIKEPQQEILPQHPNLQHLDDTRSIKSQKNPKVEKSLLKNTTDRFKPENALTFADETVFLQPKLKESKISQFTKTLFGGKNKQASVICVINYYKPEVSHIDAIAFIEKIKMEGGALHYPHCSENTYLTKIKGPSFYFTECCADCLQELAPPQKLLAFKAEKPRNNKSNIMSHIIRISRASFYFPVRCGSCSFFLCDPHKDKRQYLFVPFHSAVKDRICSSRLQSHQCEFVLAGKEYTGCRSETITNSDKQRLSRDYLIKSQHHKLYRSRSLPLLSLRKEYGSRSIMESENVAARINASVKFEDAVAKVLNIWTYEMINYEKWANSPHMRSQIMNYRKNISVFIKKDLKEKMCYRHILSVFKRVENYESPILEFKDRVSIQTNVLNYKIMQKSHSCHAKLKYEASSVIQRSDNVFWEHNNNISSLEKNDQRIESENGVEHLRSGAFCRKNIVRPLSLHSQLERKPSNAQRRRSNSFSEYKEDFSSQFDTWKNALQELQTSIDSPDLKNLTDQTRLDRSETLNRKNMVRPVSLHSELKQKTLTAPHRRRSSCSFATDRYKDFSTPITAWKNELIKLQKNAGSPTSRSLHTELNKKQSATKHRRSYSLAGSTSKEDYSTWMNASKHAGVSAIHFSTRAQGPHLGALSLNRKNLVRPLSLHSDLEQRTPDIQHRRSFSFTESAYNEAASTQMCAWDKELKELQKSVDSPNLRFGAINNKTGFLRLEPNRANAAETQRPKSESFINRFSSQINKSKLELFKLQKSFETQHLRPEVKHRHNIIKAASLHSEPKHTAAAPYRRQSESVINKEASSELNEWRNELIKLEKSVESPQSKSKIARRKVNVKAASYSGPEQRADTAAHGPKSELDDSLTELKTWNRKLRELERDAIRPHLRPKQIKRKIKARAVSLNTEPKRPPTFSTTRPKSESVLDDFSTELECWKHELLTLEEDAKNPQPETLIPQRETLTCKSIEKSCSMNSEIKYKNVAHGGTFESNRIYSKVDTSRIAFRTTRMLPLEQDTKFKTPVRRYSATPRQLPAIPTDRNMRRHSHYETTGNFVNLLSNKKATHLNAHASNPVSKNVSDSGPIYRNEASDRYLRPEESVSRSRFFSQ